MNEDDVTPTRWAVLIGINFYPERPLWGCVRDVQIIKNCLGTCVDIATLTASAPDDLNSRLPAEDSHSWPTYENVTAQFEKTTARAKHGDFVYIHFSGHGTRNEETGDLSLVLLSEVSEIRYLGGRELAALVDKMVRKGLHITLVLDCCFSGGVVRQGSVQDAAIRHIAYDSAIDALYPYAPDSCPNHQVGSSLRDASILPKWLIDPDGYTILTACGPQEKAEELILKDGKKNGALTYFLVQALNSLRKRDVEITHESLYRYLCIQFHANWPKQYPMCYGSMKFNFFGRFKSGPDRGYIEVFRTQDDQRLHLRGGHAHGVCEGDEYALCPLNAPEDVFTNIEKSQLRAKVDNVRDLTSDLAGIGPTFDLTRAKTGWKATPLTSLSTQKVLVRLMASVGNRDQWMEATKQRYTRYLSIEGEEGQPCLFNVTQNTCNEYEILDESHRKIPSLQTIPCGGNEALYRVVDTLAHLSSFKYFERIENRIPNPSLENLFELRLRRDGAEQDLGKAAIIDVQHKDKLSLTIENLSRKPLYLVVFDLGPLWQIENLLSQKGGAGFKVVEQKSEEKVKWYMTVPEQFVDRGQYQCDDILKVFVTSKPSSFTPSLLPKVHTSDGVDRSDCDHLLTFLSGLVTSTRGSEYDIQGEGWISWNFHIRTQLSR